MFLLLKRPPYVCPSKGKLKLCNFGETLNNARMKNCRNLIVGEVVYVPIIDHIL